MISPIIWGHQVEESHCDQNGEDELKAMMMLMEFWTEAMATVVHILNHSITMANENQTPYEVLKGSKPSVNHLKIFGCLTNSLVDSQ